LKDARECDTINTVLEAIRVCKDRNVLKEYLSSIEKEVVDIKMLLYDEEEIMLKNWQGSSILSSPAGKEKR